MAIISIRRYATASHCTQALAGTKGHRKREIMWSLRVIRRKPCQSDLSQAQAAWTSIQESGRHSSTRPTVATKDNQSLSSLKPNSAIACLARSADKQQDPPPIGIRHQWTSRHPFCSIDSLIGKGVLCAQSDRITHCPTSAKRQPRGHHRLRTSRFPASSCRAQKARRMEQLGGKRGTSELVQILLFS